MPPNAAQDNVVPGMETGVGVPLCPSVVTSRVKRRRDEELKRAQRRSQGGFSL